MSLPNISIPFELPIDIPLLVHPPIVHFVVAIPVVIILLEIINLGFKRRSLSLFSLFLLVMVALFTTAAYYSGSVDGKETFMFLSDDGKAELKEHKLLGVYLVYGAWAVVVLKLIFMALTKVVARLFFILILVGFSAAIMKQGKDGGEIVYKYGANNQALSDLNDEKDELQEEYDELEGQYKELQESTKEASKAEESVVIETPAPTETPVVEEATATPAPTKAPVAEEATATPAPTEAPVAEATSAVAPVNLEISSDSNGSN